MNNWGHFIHRNKWVRCHNLSENKSFRILRTDVWQNKIILRQRLARLCLGPVEVFIKMATQPEIPDLSIYLFKSYPSVSICYLKAKNSGLYPFSVKLAIYLFITNFTINVEYQYLSKSHSHRYLSTYEQMIKWQEKIERKYFPVIG